MRMAADWPGTHDSDQLRALAKALQGQCVRLRSTKSIAEDWTATELRRLEKLVDAAGSSFTWKAWAEKFPKKESWQLKDQARKMRPYLRVSTHRCTYGLGGPARCANELGSTCTFQKVPDHPKVLSHMGRVQWAKDLRCCSDHGQDTTRPLGRTSTWKPAVARVECDTPNYARSEVKPQARVRDPGNSRASGVRE